MNMENARDGKAIMEILDKKISNAAKLTNELTAMHPEEQKDCGRAVGEDFDCDRVRYKQNIEDSEKPGSICSRVF